MCEFLAEEERREMSKMRGFWSSKISNIATLGSPNVFCTLTPKLRENFETLCLLRGPAALGLFGLKIGLGNLLVYC